MQDRVLCLCTILENEWLLTLFSENAYGVKLLLVNNTLSAGVIIHGTFSWQHSACLVTSSVSHCSNGAPQDLTIEATIPQLCSTKLGPSGLYLARCGLDSIHLISYWTSIVGNFYARRDLCSNSFFFITMTLQIGKFHVYSYIENVCSVSIVFSTAVVFVVLHKPTKI